MVVLGVPVLHIRFSGARFVTRIWRRVGLLSCDLYVCQVKSAPLLSNNGAMDAYVPTHVSKKSTPRHTIL